MNEPTIATVHQHNFKKTFTVTSSFKSSNSPEKWTATTSTELESAPSTELNGSLARYKFGDKQKVYGWFFVVIGLLLEVVFWFLLFATVYLLYADVYRVYPVYIYSISSVCRVYTDPSLALEANFLSSLSLTFGDGFEGILWMFLKSENRVHGCHFSCFFIPFFVLFMCVCGVWIVKCRECCAHVLACVGVCFYVCLDWKCFGLGLKIRYKNRSFESKCYSFPAIVNKYTILFN